MRVVYLGTPDFSIAPLDAIFNSNHTLVGVITQPDKESGRGKKIAFSPVKDYALKKGIPLLQFANISRDGEEAIRKLLPDIMVTCAYGQILKQNILDICQIINIHASLLPKYRGSSPVQWALINGEEDVGVTIMKTELGVDTGDIILQSKIRLQGTENCEETLILLSDIGAKSIIKALDLIENNKAVYVKQDDSEATHCKMLKKEDGKIDFSLSNEQIKNFIRGMSPWPGAFTTLNGSVLRIRKAEICDVTQGTKIGEVVVADNKNGLIVKCGVGCLRILELQSENSKAMNSKAYLNGHIILLGSVLGE